jgi:hypothetical protein
MTESKESVSDRLGLCADCVHSRVIKSHRGSVFYFCQLSLSSSAFPKYPRLPVLSCGGHIAKEKQTAAE